MQTNEEILVGIGNSEAKPTNPNEGFVMGAAGSMRYDELTTRMQLMSGAFLVGGLLGIDRDEK